jgi:hypothetical protein
MDDGLLQMAVIDPLLERIEVRWPERARELIDAYHDVLAGKRLDEVFLSAYAPTVGEIRYLLFQICNVALLLLDQELRAGAAQLSGLEGA